MSKKTGMIKQQIAIFASGSGSNAENIIRYFDEREDIEFSIIISNKANAYVHERAKKLNVQSITLNREDLNNGDKLLDFLKVNNITHIILAGYLLKIPNKVVSAYSNRVVNIHPALLPKFGGKGMYGDNVHKAVKFSEEKESGITIHYVNEHYDEGNIIFQAKCDISPTDSYRDIADKVHKLEYKHFPEVIDKTWF